MEFFLSKSTKFHISRFLMYTFSFKNQHHKSKLILLVKSILLRSSLSQSMIEFSLISSNRRGLNPICQKEVTRDGRNHLHLLIARLLQQLGVLRRDLNWRLSERFKIYFRKCIFFTSPALPKKTYWKGEFQEIYLLYKSYTT